MPDVKFKILPPLHLLAALPGPVRSAIIDNSESVDSYMFRSDASRWSITYRFPIGEHPFDVQAFQAAGLFVYVDFDDRLPVPSLTHELITVEYEVF